VDRRKSRYDPIMKGLSLPALVMLASAGFALAQSRPFIEVQLPEHVDSRDAFIRYNVSGDDTGGWISAQPGVSSYRIQFADSDSRQLQLRAVFFAPGCDIDTLDIAVSPAGNPAQTFTCRPVRHSYITGKLTQTQWLDGRVVDVEARYVSHWAASFLQLAPTLPVVIRLPEKVLLGPDGAFQLPVPQLAKRDGVELQLWAIDRGTGDQLALLYPESNANTHNRTGSVNIETATIGRQVAFEPCMVLKSPPTTLAFIRRDAASPVPPATACRQ
jgi:hypothetical protein